MDFQTEIDQENLVLNHMTNVAVQTHQIKDRKLSSLVTGGPPLWITRQRHSQPFRAPNTRRSQQNVIIQLNWCLYRSKLIFFNLEFFYYVPDFNFSNRITYTILERAIVGIML